MATLIHMLTRLVPLAGRMGCLDPDSTALCPYLVLTVLILECLADLVVEVQGEVLGLGGESQASPIQITFVLPVIETIASLNDEVHY